MVRSLNNSESSRQRVVLIAPESAKAELEALNMEMDGRLREPLTGGEFIVEDLEKNLAKYRQYMGTA